MAAIAAKRWVGAVVLGAALIGCGGSGPEGTYELDIEETIAQAEAAMEESMAEVPEGMREMMTGMMEGMMTALKEAKVELTLSGDGTFEFNADMMGEQSTTTGTWKVDGENISMTSEIRDGEAYVDTLNGTFDSGAIRLVQEEDGQKQELVLRRT